MNMIFSHFSWKFDRNPSIFVEIMSRWRSKNRSNSNGGIYLPHNHICIYICIYITFFPLGGQFPNVGHLSCNWPTFETLTVFKSNFCQNNNFAKCTPLFHINKWISLHTYMIMWEINATILNWPIFLTFICS